MTPLMRVMLTLGAAPEGARIDQLVESLNARFNTTMRVRHARWIVTSPLTPPGLFEQAEDDEDDVVRLSPLGLRRYEFSSGTCVPLEPGSVRGA